MFIPGVKTVVEKNTSARVGLKVYGFSVATYHLPQLFSVLLLMLPLPLALTSLDPPTSSLIMQCHGVGFRV